MLIREAVESDFEAITRIYNEILIGSTTIYRDEPVSLAERVEWWRGRLEKGYPVLVGCEGDLVIAFASFGDFRAASCYRQTVEHSVHVAPEWRGQGAGSRLVRELMTRAAAMGKHVMIGGIDSENLASLRFHQRLGFEEVARFREVGFKFGRYLDLIFVQRSDLGQG